MRNIFKILGISIILTSCNTLLTSKNIQAEQVNQVGNFETISIIKVIEKGNQLKTNDSLSLLSSRKMDSIVVVNSLPKIGKKVEIEDPTHKDQVKLDILKIIAEISKTRKIETVKSSPLMDSLVKANDQRFGLCLITLGFDRKKGNYGKQIAKGVGIGILTLGTYTPVPYKSNTILHAMIFDSQDSSIVMYDVVPMVEKSPVDEKNLSELYNRVFQNYFNKK